MRIGPYLIEPALALAPMAGVTDRAFRILCKRLGAGLAASEMTIDDPRFWSTPKSRSRMNHSGEPGLIAVQIAGADPLRLAEAARHNVAQGAQIIDINMYTLHDQLVTPLNPACLLTFGAAATCHQN
jgi:tRNA-dihydrouridine synthase B